jgi:hypothetical protein
MADVGSQFALLSVGGVDGGPPMFADVLVAAANEIDRLEPN